MAENRASIETVQDFLAQKRIAMVGVSRRKNDFSVSLFQEFRGRGYDMVPVNPAMSQVAGLRCFARVQDIQPPVDAAIVMTSPAMSEQVVHDCVEAGIRRVWLYGPGGQGALNQRAVALCRAKSIDVVPGECPLMFWRDSFVGHRLHGFVLKIMGKYPQRDAA
jgi:predicted CoA-binding protein